MDNVDEYRPPWVSWDHSKEERIPLSPGVAIPGPIGKALRPYQIQGVRFLYSLYRDGEIRGGILADEMGLGKTIQVLAVLASISRKTNIRSIDLFKRRKSQNLHYLIVSPASVLYNWESEIRTWTYFSLGLYYGASRGEEFSSPERFEVVLTTYEILREEISYLSQLLPWEILVFDEIHRLKDHKSKTTKILKPEFLSVPFKIGLSGTLIQNKYSELWSVLDWANPGCLGKLKYFTNKYAKPIQAGLRLDATKSQLAKARLLQKDIDAIKSRWIIRRTKGDECVSLPTKVDKIVYCAPTPFQISVFKSLLETPEMKEFWGNPAEVRNKRKTKTEKEKKKTKIFTFIHLFLKVANHAGLLSSKYNSSSENQLKFATNAINKVMKEFPSEYKGSFLDLSDTKYSGKMLVLADLLAALEKETDTRNQILLFSYSTKVLDILETFIRSRSYEYRRIDGSTRSKIRYELVNEFNENANIFILLLSTKAAGIGLNITGANVVIVYDPNWNPSHDLQAQDRAYRIGQTRDVRVFRLVTSGCIEENIYLRQLYKQQLCRNALDGVQVRRYFRGCPNEEKGELFGVKNLFTVKSDGGASLTESIFKRNKDVEKQIKSRKFRIEEFELETKPDNDDPFLIKDSLEDSEEKIISNYRKKKEVNSVLKSDNVSLVHDNSSVVGGSKVEDHVSECAILGDDTQSLLPAVQSPKKSVTPKASNSLFPPLRKLRAYRDRIYRTSEGTLFYGQTPATIKKTTFSKMAEYSKKSEVEFAKFILEMNPGSLAKFLEKYYAENRGLTECVPLFKDIVEEINKEETELLARSKKKDPTSRDFFKPKRNKATVLPKKQVDYFDDSFRDIANEFCEEETDSLFPRDSFFDVTDEPFQVSKSPKVQKSKISNVNSIGEEISNQEELDAQETQCDLFTNVISKSPSSEDNLSCNASDTETRFEKSESILSSPKRESKPAPEGIFYSQRENKSPCRTNFSQKRFGDFYDCLFQSQFSPPPPEPEIFPSVERKRDKKKVNFESTSDSQFFEAIFSSPVKKSKIEEEEEDIETSNEDVIDPLLTQWVKKGRVTKQ